MLGSVGYTPGAEDNALARWLGVRIEQAATNRVDARRALRAMRAVVCVVAPDRRLAATMRFDHGLVTLHDGMVGVADLTLCADFPLLELLGSIEPPSWRSAGWRLAHPTDGAWSARRRVATALLDGRIRLYGALVRPRLVVRLLRVLRARR